MRDTGEGTRDALRTTPDASGSTSASLDRDPDLRNRAHESQNGAAPTSGTAPFTLRACLYAAIIRGEDRGGGTGTARDGAEGSATGAAIADPAAAIVSMTTITVTPSVPSRALKSSRILFRRLRTASALIPSSAAVFW